MDVSPCLSGWPVPEEWAARDLVLRVENETDAAFVEKLFLSVRMPMFESADLPEESKRALLASQAAIQRRAYRMSYPDADFLVIEEAHEPIGRIYLSRNPGNLRVIDISLLPQARGRGLGTALIRGVQRMAAAEGRSVSLQVDPFNPALPLYRRLGFEQTGEEAGGLGLRWR